MPRMTMGLSLTALAGALLAASLTPAAAQNSHRTTREFTAQQRPQIVIHPRRRLGPNATRHCKSWLAKRTWPNGQIVITPQMRCWWED
jgi:hypothetical protein